MFTARSAVHCHSAHTELSLPTTTLLFPLCCSISIPVTLRFSSVLTTTNLFYTPKNKLHRKWNLHMSWFWQPKKKKKWNPCKCRVFKVKENVYDEKLWNSVWRPNKHLFNFTFSQTEALSYYFFIPRMLFKWNTTENNRHYSLEIYANHPIHQEFISVP